VSWSADKYETLSFIFQEMGLHNRGQNLEVNKLSSYQNNCFGCITHLLSLSLVHCTLYDVKERKAGEG
jgi:hypothetical protein